MNSSNGAGSIIHRPPYYEAVYEFNSHLDLSNFTDTQINSGTTVQQAAVNGIERISGAATTASSGRSWQQTKATFQLVADKPHVISFRVAPSSASLVKFLMGLCVIDTSLIASAPSDGIYLYKATSGTELDLIVMAGSAQISSTVIDTGVDTSMHNWGMEIVTRPDPTKATVYVTKDGKIVKQVDLTGLPSTALLAPSIEAQSGDNTGTQYLDVDRIWFRLPRVVG